MKKKGFYDLLLNKSDDINDSYLVKSIEQEKNNISDINNYLSSQFISVVTNYLANIETVSDKISFLNKLLSVFSNQQFSNDILLQIKDSQKDSNYESSIRLADNYLFTNKDEQILVEQLYQEIITSDSVAFIYPFISKSMINKLKDAFDFALQYSIEINIITTTFDDQALFVSLFELEQLVKSYSNISIRIEDNTEIRSERIHIKAAIFQRKSGFSSAIIGSSNLTIQGMQSGREWNLRISQFENYNLYHKIYQEYKNLWEEGLLDFNDDSLRQKLFERIKHQRFFNIQNTNHIKLVNYVLYDFQIAILEKLAYRRKINKNKHLIVMATGTGKTVVSAFDYLKQIQTLKKKPKLLFLAHQKEIIEQALITFRKVLNDSNFGNVLSSKSKNFASEYLFATIQTIHRNLNKFNKQQFDLIIFDEAHHIAASTFDKVFKYFQAKEIIGLTATPEREDNKSILSYFDDEFAYELRLWDAINQRLLSKFDYYCIDDVRSNLIGVDLNNEQQVFKVLNTSARNELLFDVIKNYIGFYHQPLSLIFCINIKHAEIISNFLISKGLKSSYLTSAVSGFTRKNIINNFKSKKINYLCVVNIFNEGMDIPEVDTIILLRPTNSKTIFLQQLGRGLRKTYNKNKLSVYDLIANIDQKYDITIGIKNLYHNSFLVSKQNLLTNNGLNLPGGCTITLEPKSKEVILNNLQSWYKTPNRIYKIIKEYYHKYKMKGLERIIADYDMNLALFYQHLNTFYFKVACTSIINENQTKRNFNILKQFIFLNNYSIVRYFYLRLKQDDTIEINYHYDNLLIASLFPEITSMKLFNFIFASYSDDLVFDFIKNHKLVVQELLMILEYKINYETLIICHSENKDFPLLIKSVTYTIRQALVAINRLNFFHQLGSLKIIAFQAGYLTYNQTNSVVFADIDAKNYGKLTKYNSSTQEFYWSIPENKTINSKLVKDLESDNIVKFLFLNDNLNKNYSNLSLKLYNFIGIGTFLETLKNKYITIKFRIKS